MRKDIVSIANRLIPKPSKIETISPEFRTDDIIQEVLSKFDRCKQQLTGFAPYLKGSTVRETCYNIWHFWRKHITYVADNAGARQQIVKSPAAVWADRFCDCKSFSVAVMSCLHELGIKGVFRFVSFNDRTKTIPTHVYVVAFDPSGIELIIDCCLPNFNMQKPYKAKYDYLGPGLHSVTGVDQAEVGKLRLGKFLKKALSVTPAGMAVKALKGKKGLLKKALSVTPAGMAVKALRKKRERKTAHHLGPANPRFKELVNLKKKRGVFTLSGVKNEAELELMIQEHKLELEQDKAAKVFGIGSVHDNAYEIELAAINNAICEIGNPELIRLQDRRVRTLRPAAQDTFIGKPSARKAAKKAKKETKKTEKAVKRNEKGKGINKKDQKRLAKINVTVKKKKEGILKKVAKAVTKVVTAPLRLLAKGALELILPKAAPIFLYLFLNDPKVLAKAPEAVKRKRAKAQSIAKFITQKISMKEAHFMGILRNGIMNNLGDTPENVLAQWMRDANFQIGLLPALATAGKFAVDLLKKVGGAKIENLQNDAPDPSDWMNESQATREDLANNVQAQAANNDVTDNRGSIPVTQPDYSTQSYVPPYMPSSNNYGGGSFSNSEPEYEKGENEDPDDYGTDKTLENVTVTAKRKAAETSGNGLLIAAAAALVLVSMGNSNSGGKKKGS